MISLRNALKMDVGKNIYLCMLAAGVIVFIFYCMRIQFLPTGLTLSDVIFFLMVIVSFSLILVFFIVCWYSMSIMVSAIFMKVSFLVVRNRKNVKLIRNFKGTRRIARRMKFYEPLWAHFLISFIGVLTILVIEKARGIDMLSVSLSIAMTAFCLTLIPNIYFDKRIHKQKKNKMVGFIAVIALFFFFLLSGMAPVLSDAGMSIIGVKKTNVTVILQGDDLQMARHLTENPNQNYFKGEALFTGVGTTSLLVINKKKIVVKNENLSLAF